MLGYPRFQPGCPPTAKMFKGRRVKGTWVPPMVSTLHTSLLWEWKGFQGARHKNTFSHWLWASNVDNLFLKPIVHNQKYQLAHLLSDHEWQLPVVAGPLPPVPIPCRDLLGLPPWACAPVNTVLGGYSVAQLLSNAISFVCPTCGSARDGVGEDAILWNVCRNARNSPVFPWPLVAECSMGPATFSLDRCA